MQQPQRAKMHTAGSPFVYNALEIDVVLQNHSRLQCADVLAQRSELWIFACAQLGTAVDRDEEKALLNTLRTWKNKNL